MGKTGNLLEPNRSLQCPGLPEPSRIPCHQRQKKKPGSLTLQSTSYSKLVPLYKWPSQNTQQELLANYCQMPQDPSRKTLQPSQFNGHCMWRGKYRKTRQARHQNAIYSCHATSRKKFGLRVFFPRIFRGVMACCQLNISLRRATSRCWNFAKGKSKYEGWVQRVVWWLCNDKLITLCFFGG